MNAASNVYVWTLGAARGWSTTRLRIRDRLIRRRIRLHGCDDQLFATWAAIHTALRERGFDPPDK